MTEIIFAVVVVALSAGGIGVGLLFGRGPARTSCGATDELDIGKCDDCPLRKRARRRATT